jgi:hypothetical protein
LTIEGAVMPLVWREHRVVAVTDEPPAAIADRLDAMAFTVVKLPAEIPAVPPTQLAELLGDLV